jgi:hypothetical protein
MLQVRSEWKRENRKRTNGGKKQPKLNELFLYSS